MTPEEYLEILKKDYEKTEATMHLKMQGWSELEKRIDLISPKPARPRWFNFAVTCALILLFAGSLFTAVATAQAALPGDVLYPVKLLSEKIVQKTSGNNQVVVDHRADEIVGLSKKDDVNKEQLQQVVIEYKQSVDQAKQDIQISGKPSINFQNQLDEQHSEFDKISRDHPDIQKEIKDAQDASDHAVCYACLKNYFLSLADVDTVK